MRESKISNIAITIDKVMHVLQSMGTMEPPIRELSFKEVGSTYRFIIIINIEILKDLVGKGQSQRVPCPGTPQAGVPMLG
jgi:hypothetical protein